MLPRLTSLCAPLLPVVFCLGVLPACTVIDVRNTTAFTNDRGEVSPGILRGIHRGETGSDWLLHHLGYPDRITREGEDTEIWHYRVRERRDNLYRVILVFQYRSAESYRRDMYVKLVDQLVVDAWGDFDFDLDAGGDPETESRPAPGSPVINQKKRGKARMGAAISRGLDPFSEDIISE